MYMQAWYALLRLYKGIGPDRIYAMNGYKPFVFETRKCNTIHMQQHKFLSSL